MNPLLVIAGLAIVALVVAKRAPEAAPPAPAPAPPPTPGAMNVMLFGAGVQAAALEALRQVKDQRGFRGGTKQAAWESAAYAGFPANSSIHAAGVGKIIPPAVWAVGSPWTRSGAPLGSVGVDSDGVMWLIQPVVLGSDDGRISRWLIGEFRETGRTATVSGYLWGLDWPRIVPKSGGGYEWAGVGTAAHREGRSHTPNEILAMNLALEAVAYNSAHLNRFRGAFQ